MRAEVRGQIGASSFLVYERRNWGSFMTGRAKRPKLVASSFLLEAALLSRAYVSTSEEHLCR